jgi:hypothetical protein
MPNWHHAYGGPQTKDQPAHKAKASLPYYFLCGDDAQKPCGTTEVPSYSWLLVHLNERRQLPFFHGQN